MNDRFRNTFDQIHASEDLKSSTMEFLKKERGQRTAKVKYRRNSSSYRSGRRWMRAALAFCLLFFVIGAFGGYQYTIRPHAYISIDVNPSLELVLNRTDHVIRATAYNKDGENILDGIDVKGLVYTDAVKKIMISPSMKKYLGESYDVVITTASGEKEKYITSIKECLENDSVEYVATDLSEVEEAHSHHCSVGKYTAFKELSEYDSDLTVDDCENMSIKEIHSQIEKHECEENSEEESCEDENSSTAGSEQSESVTMDNEQQESETKSSHEKEEEGHEKESEESHHDD